MPANINTYIGIALVVAIVAFAVWKLIKALSNVSMRNDLD
jgi:hypothetical protein